MEMLRQGIESDDPFSRGTHSMKNIPFPNICNISMIMKSPQETKPVLILVQQQTECTHKSYGLERTVKT